MAHLGREPGVAFDPDLERLGHHVERRGEQIDVGVVALGQTRVEASTGDRLGGLAHLEQRRDHRARRPEPDGTGEQGGEDRGAGECDGEAVERALELGEGDSVVVLRVETGQRDADDEHRCAIDAGPDRGRLTTLHHRDERGRERAFVERGEIGGVPLSVEVQQRRGVLRGREREQVLADVDGSGVVGQAVGEQHCVLLRTRGGGRLALVEQDLAREPVGDDRECDRQRGGAEGEREHESTSEPEAATHRSDDAHPSTRAGAGGDRSSVGRHWSGGGRHQVWSL